MILGVIMTHSETVEAVKSKIDLIADVLLKGRDVEIRNLPSMKTVKIIEVRKIDVCKREAVQGGSSGFNGADDKTCVEAEKTALQVNTTC